MKKLKPVLPIIITLCIVLIFSIQRFVFLKFYPPICNFCIFMTFFTSLFMKETIIQKFAQMSGDKLEGGARIYTRNITYIWAAFTFINFLISVWTIFLPEKYWIMYNGCISYILVGLLFGVEYTVRIILRKRKLI